MSVHDDDFADLLARAVANLDPTLTKRLDDEPDAHLELVVLTHRTYDEAGRLLGSAVTSARAAGWSWEKIGEVMGMSRQAAQQRFGKGEITDALPEHRRLVGLTAFTEIEELNEWGRHGWHSVAFGPAFHDVEASDQQWEHRRAVVGSRRAKDLETRGWERIGTLWFPWIFFKRPLDRPAEPGEPQ